MGWPESRGAMIKWSVSNIKVWDSKEKGNNDLYFGGQPPQLLINVPGCLELMYKSLR